MTRGLGMQLLLLCLLTGCASTPQWTPRPVVTERPTPTSESGSPSSPASPTSAAPTIPAASGAIDANGYDSAHFASPTGRIWCALYAEWTLCHFPNGMDTSQVPDPDEVCPGAELDVTGVSLVEKADYFCSGGAEALPQTNGEYVGWWKKAKLPSVTYDGQKLAVLPYGRKLAKGPWVCESAKSGVTCGNTATGKGFRVALAGVTLIG